MTLAVISLGANLGDQVAALRSGVQALATADATTVVGVSSIWRTEHVGGPEQPDYRNAVVLIETALTAWELLGVCQSAEQRAGRERTVRWGPRTLDLDIVDFAGVTSNDPNLEIPHARAHERAFVLAPWAELAPQWPLTARGVTQPVVQWLAQVADQQIMRLPEDDWWS